jgi:hypothetical protein
MERFFQIAAVILAGVAAYFLWNDNGDGAFVSGVLGAVAFFLSVRFQVKGRLQQREIERLEEEEMREKREIVEPRPYFGELGAETATAATENEQRTAEKTL